MTPGSRPLTPKQAAVLGFIEGHLRKNARAPSLREIGAHFGIRSTNGVLEHLKALERKGFISREETARRGIHVRPREFSDVCVCPTCGRPTT